MKWRVKNNHSFIMKYCGIIKNLKMQNDIENESG